MGETRSPRPDEGRVEIDGTGGMKGVFFVFVSFFLWSPGLLVVLDPCRHSWTRVAGGLLALVSSLALGAAQRSLTSSRRCLDLARPSLVPGLNQLKDRTRWTGPRQNLVFSSLSL